jgi:hypothetical protein
MPEAMKRDEAFDATVAARLAEMTARFGERLSEDDLAGIRKQVRETIEQADAMRKVKLANADEPEIVFVPYRGSSS